MTLSEHAKRTAEGVVDSLWYRGIARGAMIVAVPLLGWMGNRTYDLIDRIDQREVRLESDHRLLQQAQENDRANVSRLVDNVNDRVTILSNRITDVARDLQANYARIGDVKSGFDLRDQRLNALEGRDGRSAK